jgi:alpha-tubulin suppressor-like RCC1 family protein
VSSKASLCQLVVAVAVVILALPSAGARADSAIGWGENWHYNLGAGYRSERSDVPASVAHLVGVREVAAGGGSGIALMEDGTLEAWGGNHNGQLGDGTLMHSPTPKPVPGVSGVVQIAMSGEHVAALLSSGHVLAWGSNLYGQLGNGTTGEGKESNVSRSAVPVEVAGISNAVSLALGGASDAAVLADGTVLAWGENLHGELGDGTTVEKDVPTPVRNLTRVKSVAIGGIATLGGHSAALLSDGTVEAWGTDKTGSTALTPQAVAGLSGVVQISAGYTDTFALLSNGTLEAWGTNASGELGYRTTETCGRQLLPCSRRPRPVPGISGVASVTASGFQFTVAVVHGQALAWGRNQYGQLGNGAVTVVSPPKPVVGLNTVTQVAAAELHSIAIFQQTPIPPALAVEAGKGTLTMHWTVTQSTEPWRVNYRPIAFPADMFGTPLSIPSSASSYTFSGLTPGVPYEVKLASELGPYVAVGTPG